MTSTSRRTRRDRPAGAPATEPGFHVVGPVAVPDADAVDRRPGGGFTTGRPWLRLGADAARRNVAVRAGGSGSVLACYRRLHRRPGSPRRASRAADDASSPADHPTVLAYRRGARTPRPRLVAINTAGDAGRGQRGRRSSRMAPGGRSSGTHRDLPALGGSDGALVLRPFEACVLVRAEAAEAGAPATMAADPSHAVEARTCRSNS